MEFSKEIINVLDYLCGKFGIAIDWTSDNVMPYLKDLCGRYINYEVYTSIVWMITFTVITLLIAIPLTILHKKANKLNWNDCYGTVVFAIIFWTVFAVMVFSSVCVICTQIFDIVECCTLPEKVILEYLNSLVNTPQ